MRSLRRTLIYQITAVIICLLVVSVAAISGIHGLNQDLSLATRGYERLRDVYEIGTHLSTARTLASLDHPDLLHALIELQSAETKWEIERDESPAAGGGPSPDLLTLHNHILAAQHIVRQAIDSHSTSVDITVFQQALGATAFSASNVRESIQRAQYSADLKRRFTIVTVSTVCTLLIIDAVMIGLWQYRSIMRPVNELSDGVRHIASGEFSRKLNTQGHREFNALAMDFNQMASQLDQLYHHLEQEVEQKSRELVRSQHLASVGFLAAGVAHEINNPLGVITGFAEFTLEQVRQSPAHPGTQQIDKALQAICDEAFRCKQITEQLLSMARSTEAPRSRVNLAVVAEDVLPLVKALKPYQNRTIYFSCSGFNFIMANESEMRQVVLNLLTNALEACGELGDVTVTVRRAEQTVELSIKDTGRGMAPQTLERVFEPFFTLPHDGRRGTGLGLSITHAIVEAHNGTITARSDGLGCGSEFVVGFPAA